MEHLIIYLTNLLAFIFVITVLIGFHEYAHYYVAKKIGVKVEIFSIGIGKILFSRVDKHGTKWCICLLPIGGYVKMFGDKDMTSSLQYDINQYTDEEKKYTFINKSPLQRLAIVAAGPISNYILAFLIFFSIYSTYGVQEHSPVISKVEYNSPAYKAGIQQNDIILSVNNNKVTNFFDAKILMQTSSIPIKLNIERDAKIIEYEIIPNIVEVKDITGRMRKSKIIGVSSDNVIYRELSITDSIKYSLHDLYFDTKIVFTSIIGLFTGAVSIDDMSGITTIAEISGTVARVSIVSLFLFIASFSVNLAALNLLPIPVLDGGHIMFYIYELIFKKPINFKIQNFTYKIGALIIFAFMLWVNITDILHIF